MNLQGRVALVTGANGGIGRATALRLAEAGADLAIGYGYQEQAALAVAEQVRHLGRKAIAVGGDLRDPAQVRTLVETTESRLGPVDFLISNAGAGTPEKLEEISVEEWDQTMNINVRPAFLLAQLITPGMRARKFGRVIFVSSVAAFTGGIIGPHYAASLAPDGVTVNAVAPALIAGTGIIAGTAHDQQKLAPHIPVGRPGKPEEVAEVILLLLGNAYLTNQTISLDGGMHPR